MTDTVTMKTNNYTTPLVRVIPVTTRTHICQPSPAYTKTEAMQMIGGGSMDD